MLSFGRPKSPLCPAGESTYFLSVNRNKRSIELDMASSAGKAALLQLAAKCDVVVENFIPGKLHSMGLGYKAMKAVKDDIIYVNISGGDGVGCWARFDCD